MRNKLYVILLFSCVGAIAQGRIDGFYKEKGSGAVVIGFGYQDAVQYYAGREALNIERTVFYSSLFASYGITDDLEVNVALPYIISDDNKDFQDLALMMKYRLYLNSMENGNLELSLATGFSTPVSNYEIGGLNDIGQQATVIETRAMVHYAGQNLWFITLQSGFSFKLQETPNSIPFTIKAGRATAKWYYDLFYDYQYSFGGIDYRGTPSPQNFSEFGVDFHKIGGTLYKPFLSSLGVYTSLSYVITGRNIFSGPTYGVGLVYNY